MRGVSVDVTGNVYVVDSGNARVMKWAPGGTAGSIVAGGNGTGSAANQLNSPVGLFVETVTLAIWIADTNNHRIVRWSTPTGSDLLWGSFGIGSSQLNYPHGLFVSTNNSTTVYVADTSNHRIQKWVPGAINATTVAGKSGVYGSGNDTLYFPQAILVDTNGDIFISDSFNNRIMHWPANSAYGLLVAGSNAAGLEANLLNTPLGLCFDRNGGLVIADFRNMRVQNFFISCRE